ncbi:MAG: PTS transporter subunit EIIB [Butyricicoccus pullicaecorum]|nr:PTS transporter subunit EIIB [Butyricicoccus pullicaecorum]
MNPILLLLAAAVVVLLGLYLVSRRKNNSSAGTDYLAAQDYSGLAKVILDNIGGAQNLSRFDHCVSRLRLEVKNPELVNEKPIKAAGIAGLMRPEKTKVQLIIGSKVQLVSDALKSLVD